MLSLTLVIPVYNEENQIEGCLESIKQQLTMPDEVIVVDNNCTDRTMELVAKYDFVKVIKESKQGRGYARTSGFNQASSDIIGRIDADSRLMPDWVEKVKHIFESHSDLAGLTGLGMTSFIPGINGLKSTLFSRSYFWFVHLGFKTNTMWGANMAIRKVYWEKVMNKVCNDDDLVHEDQDLSLCIAANGGKIIRDNELRIIANGAGYMNINKILLYRKLYFSTKRIHTNNGNLQKVPITHRPLQGLIGVVVVYFIGSLILLINLFLQILIFPIKKLIKII